ncbi:MAG: ectonucleotide pyrophosphatase/phosphodiesterase [Cyclobacteriaceae bacterium]
MVKYILVVVLCGTLYSCATNSSSSQSDQHESPTNREWAKNQPYVVLISFDGFRYDYARKYGATNILRFMESGVTTDKMIPSFPSKTFPNHYTLVTGMYPSTHGLVSNEFYSREKDATYKVGDQEAVHDAAWYGGKPLWVLAEEAGMLSASYFWVGSEAAIGGRIPAYMKPYDGSVPNQERFEKVVDWLKLPEAKRPHFIATYFSIIDDVGHSFGPNSKRTEEAVLSLDQQFGEFMDQLAEVDVPVNVILVADHGMSEISRGVVLCDIVDVSDCKVTWSFPPMIYCEDSSQVNELQRIINADGRIAAWKPEELPERLHLSAGDRVGDLILYTEAPLVILKKPQVVKGGTHGFNPYTNDDMGALFAAQGPSFKSGINIEEFENIHVFPLMAKILGLQSPDDVDGRLEVLEPILKE